MKQNEIQIGTVYLARVSRSIVRVRVNSRQDRIRNLYGTGFEQRSTRTTQELRCTNLSTGREIICTAARLRKASKNQETVVSRRVTKPKFAYLCVADLAPRQVKVLRINNDLTAVVEDEGGTMTVPQGNLCKELPKGTLQFTTLDKCNVVPAKENVPTLNETYFKGLNETELFGFYAMIMLDDNAHPSWKDYARQYKNFREYITNDQDDGRARLIEFFAMQKMNA